MLQAGNDPESHDEPILCRHGLLIMYMVHR